MADENLSTGEDSLPEITPEKAKVPWVPLVLVLLFIPIITLVLVELVVVPKLKSSLADGEQHVAGAVEAPANGGEAPAEGGHGGGHGGGGGEAEAIAMGGGSQVVFDGVVTNISGTMGTRFLKVSFQTVGTDNQLAAKVANRQAQVKDAIISTLSGMSMRELEAPGGRNTIRVALIGAINGALGLNLVKELYFTEFIVQ